MGYLLLWELQALGRFVHMNFREVKRSGWANVRAESHDARIEVAKRADTIISGSLISLTRNPDTTTSKPSFVDRISAFD